MSLEGAHRFVAKMKEDREFRSAVSNPADKDGLNNCLLAQGYEFSMGELIAAMAACMAELDKMTLGC